MRWAILLLLVACGSSDSGEMEAESEYPPNLPLEASYTECATVDDCVVIELGCCDECNGGLAVAVNADSESEVRERFTEDCGSGQDCTLIGCAPWELICVDDACGVVRGTTY